MEHLKYPFQVLQRYEVKNQQPLVPYLKITIAQQHRINYPVAYC